MNGYARKLVMVAIILSCGFVIQAGESERTKLKQEGAEVYLRQPVREAAVPRHLHLRADRSW